MEDLHPATTDGMDNATSLFENMYQSGKVAIIQKVMLVFLALAMFGMGCAVDHDMLRHNLKRPVGIGTGLACQLFLMPVLTYCFISFSSMTEIQSVAFMLIGSCPGGMQSNFITYFLQGDLSLSVTMSAFTNILALGALPLAMTVFSHVEQIDAHLRIPFKSIGLSLIALIVPIVAGLLYRWKFPRRVDIIGKVCGVLGFVFIVTTLITLGISTNVPITFDPNVVIPTSFLPLVSMSIAYLVAQIPQLKMSPGAKKAIAIEVSIQNAGLANSVLVLSYGDRYDLFKSVILLPISYQIFQVSTNLIIVISYHIWLRFFAHQKQIEDSTEPQTQPILEENKMPTRDPLNTSAHSK